MARTGTALAGNGSFVQATGATWDNPDRHAPSTDQFTIVDTEGNEFRPVPLNVEANPFVYEPIDLLHSQVLPTPDSAAASGPIQGSLILFRLKTDSLQNRPLRFEIEQGGADTPTGEIDLDL